MRALLFLLALAALVLFLVHGGAWLGLGSPPPSGRTRWLGEWSYTHDLTGPGMGDTVGTSSR